MREAETGKSPPLRFLELGNWGSIGGPLCSREGLDEFFFDTGNDDPPVPSEPSDSVHVYWMEAALQAGQRR